MVKCLTCGGVYAPIGRDGLRYFHACPPLSDPEAKAALGIVGADALLTAAQRRQIADYPRARPAARDENVTIDPQTGTGVPKAEGSGIVDV